MQILRLKLRKLPRRRGLGLVELLIALSIAAVLLTATAVAVDASFKAYTANQEQSILLQQARMALNRITYSIRTTAEHSPANPALVEDFTAGLKVTGSSIEMFEGKDPNTTKVVYWWDSDKKLLITEITPSGGEKKSYVLARGVEDFQISMEPMRSRESLRTGGAYDLLRRATILITIRTTEQTAKTGESTNRHPVTLSVSVTPRQNSW